MDDSTVTADANTNPFTENDAAGQYFVGRDRELRAAEHILWQASGGDSVGAVVAGPHGRGKSSLLQQIQRQGSERGLVVVWSECNEGHSNHSAASDLLQQCCRVIDKGRGGSVLEDDWTRKTGSSLFRVTRTESLTTNDMIEDFTRLHSVAVGERGHRGLVLLLDEAQRLDSSFLSILRNASKHCRNLAIVLAVRIQGDQANPTQIAAEAEDWLSSKAVDAERDMGTAAFFNDIIALGPFETPTEARQCIRRRLRGRPIAFDDVVIDQVIDMCEFVPRWMMQLCKRIYNHCLLQGIGRADIQVFEFAFRQHYDRVLNDAHDVVAQLSEHQRAVLKALISEGGRSTVPALTKAIFHSFADTDPEGATRYIVSCLTRISELCGELQVNDQSVALSSPPVRYAIDCTLKDFP